MTRPDTQPKREGGGLSKEEEGERARKKAEATTAEGAEESAMGVLYEAAQGASAERLAKIQEELGKKTTEQREAKEKRKEMRGQLNERAKEMAQRKVAFVLGGLRNYNWADVAHESDATGGKWIESMVRQSEGLDFENDLITKKENALRQKYEQEFPGINDDDFQFMVSAYRGEILRMIWDSRGTTPQEYCRKKLEETIQSWAGEPEPDREVL